MIKRILPLLAFALLLVSCKENLTSLNEDPKNPAEVPGDPLFTNAEVTLGTYLDDPDYNRNPFLLYAQYWAETTYSSESQYELTTRQIPSNMWEDLYTDVLKDLDQAKQTIQSDSLTEDAVKKNKIASINIIQVLTFSELVNVFGNIPYKNALNSGNTLPEYNDAKTIYMDLLSRLDTAIGNLDPSADGFGTADVFYQGDIDKWIMFANSIKMRLGITLADVDPATARKAVESASPDAFQSNDDNAMIQFESSPPNTSPIWESLVQSGRHDFVPANTLIDEMNTLNDPRREQFFTQYNGSYAGGTYGTTNAYGSYSHMSDKILARDLPGIIMEYPEVEFIRAEAAQRGYSVSGSAESHYNAAITADMEYWDVPNSEISKYLKQDNVSYSNAAANGTEMQRIGEQKWLGLYLQGLQAWTEWRRLDAPEFNPPPGMTKGDIPVRFTYPVTEQNLNTDNYNKAASAMGGDKISSHIFWDVK